MGSGAADSKSFSASKAALLTYAKLSCFIWLQRLESNIHSGISNAGESFNCSRTQRRNSAATSTRFALNHNMLRMPWVPAVLHFAKACFMGVLYPGCITRNECTRRSATKAQLSLNRPGGGSTKLPENRLWKYGNRKQRDSPHSHNLDDYGIIPSTPAHM